MSDSKHAQPDKNLSREWRPVPSQAEGDAETIDQDLRRKAAAGAEHEKTVTVGVSPENAYRYLSSVSHLPQFVPHLREIREDQNNHVFGVSEFQGKRCEVSGFFRADEANRRLDWESDGTPGYRGWLRIEPAGAERSRITVHISLAGVPEDAVTRQMETVLGRMCEVLEREAAVMA